MPTFNYIQPPPNSTGRKVRVVTVDTDKDIPVGCQADPDDAAAVAKVTNAAPPASAYGGVVRMPEPGAAAMSQASQDVATAVLLAANAARRGFLIENTADVADLHVAFGATASLTAYTRKLRPGEQWDRRGGYTGVISGIWSAAGAGKAIVTEET